MLLFLLLVRSRIQIHLKDRIQPLHTQQSLAHRRQHLNIIRGGVHKFRKLLQDQLQCNINDLICLITFQEKEIHALIVQTDLFPPVNFVGIDNYVTGTGLAKNLFKLHRVKQPGIDDIL